MPKARRIEYPGAFYHVINRGRNKSDIFHNEIDFRLFLKIIRETTEKFDAIVHSYCLMSNHYHLLIETPRGNLSEIMHNIGTMYVQKYNHLKGCDGSLFKGRYKAILVDKSSYMIWLNRYIHRNPLAITKDLKSYPWSSYRSYLELAATPSWLNKEQTLDLLEVRDDLNKYVDFVENNQKNEKKLYDNRKTFPSILGSKSFIKSLKSFK